MLNNSNLKIVRLDACSFRDALRLWNEGFAGYFLDMTLSLDSLLARWRACGLSPELSLAAFVDGRPAGFVVNGLRDAGGGREAWNGGTGVAPEFRRRGLGKALVAAALDVYRERGAATATLEALAQNKAAISLYEQLGYGIAGRLLLLESRGRLAPDSFGAGDDQAHAVTRAAPHEVARLDFYDGAVPWQSRWQSVQLCGGEGLVVSDAAGAAAGYALYTKGFDAEGKLTGITLYQCAHAPGRDDAEAIIARALRGVYSPLGADCRRTTHNLGASCEVLLRALRGAGFAVFAEQVQMSIDLRGAAQLRGAGSGGLMS